VFIGGDETVGPSIPGVEHTCEKDDDTLPMIIKMAKATFLKELM
jgi:hypothetical protein